MLPSSPDPSNGTIKSSLNGGTKNTLSSHSGMIRIRRPALDPSDLLVTSTAMKNSEEKQGGHQKGGGGVGPGSSAIDGHSLVRSYHNHSSKMKNKKTHSKTNRTPAKMEVLWGQVNTFLPKFYAINLPLQDRICGHWVASFTSCTQVSPTALIERTLFTHYQHTINTLCNTPCHYTLSTHPLNPPSPPTLSTHPLHPPTLMTQVEVRS